MKTLLVCDEKSVNNHVGEEYDEILEVVKIPTTENIRDWANKIKNTVCSLWNSDKEESRKIIITLDSSAPYKAVLINLKIKMGIEDKITIELLGIDGGSVEEK